jgi:hypothetical protein
LNKFNKLETEIILPENKPNKKNSVLTNFNKQYINKSKNNIKKINCIKKINVSIIQRKLIKKPINLRTNNINIEQFDYIYYLVNNWIHIHDINEDNVYKHYLNHKNSSFIFRKKENYSILSHDLILLLHPTIHTINEKNIFLYFIRNLNKNDYLKYSIQSFNLYKYKIWTEYNKIIEHNTQKIAIIYVYNSDNPRHIESFFSKINTFISDNTSIYVLYSYSLPELYNNIPNVNYTNVSYYSNILSAFSFLIYTTKIVANKFILIDSTSEFSISFLFEQLNKLNDQICLIGSHKLFSSGSDKIQKYPHINTDILIFNKNALKIWHNTCILIDLLYSIQSDIICKSKVLITKTIEEQQKFVDCFVNVINPQFNLSYFDKYKQRFEKKSYKYAFVIHIYQNNGFDILYPYIAKIKECFNSQQTLFIFTITGCFTNYDKLNNLLQSLNHMVCLKTINVGLDSGGFLIGCLWIKMNLTSFPEFICKIHSKGAHATHHQSILSNIINPLIDPSIDKLFDPSIGMYGSSTYYINENNSFYSNIFGISYLYYKTFGHTLKNIKKHFYAGTMFWIKGTILSDSLTVPLINSYISDFQYGTVGQDCHLPHAWERFYSILVQQKQYKLFHE